MTVTGSQMGWSLPCMRHEVEGAAFAPVSEIDLFNLEPGPEQPVDGLDVSGVDVVGEVGPVEVPALHEIRSGPANGQLGARPFHAVRADHPDDPAVSRAIDADGLAVVGDDPPVHGLHDADCEQMKRIGVADLEHGIGGFHLVPIAGAKVSADVFQPCDCLLGRYVGEVVEFDHGLKCRPL